MRSSHLLTDRRRLLHLIHQMWRHLEVQLNILFVDVLINAKSCLRVTVDLIDVLWTLLLRQLCSNHLLSRLWILIRLRNTRRGCKSALIFIAEQEFYFLANGRFNMLLSVKD